MITRRSLAAGLAFGFATPALAQNAGHDPLYSGLKDPKLTDLPHDTAMQQRVFDTPAPKAANQGRWVARANLPLPRSEMAWATVLDNKMHIVGGYGEQRVDRPYHHAYDQKADKWLDAPQLPRGADHVGVVTMDGRLYAIGGYTEQNRKPDNLCFVFEGNAWRKIASLPRAFAAIGCASLNGFIHAIGGAIGDTFADNASTASTPIRTCITPMTPRRTNGLRARPYRPPAPATARCSTATRFSSWAAKAPTACSIKTKPMTSRPIAG